MSQVPRWVIHKQKRAVVSKNEKGISPARP